MSFQHLAIIFTLLTLLTGCAGSRKKEEDSVFNKPSNIQAKDFKEIIGNLYGEEIASLSLKYSLEYDKAKVVVMDLKFGGLEKPLDTLQKIKAIAVKTGISERTIASMNIDLKAMEDKECNCER